MSSMMDIMHTRSLPIPIRFGGTGASTIPGVGILHGTTAGMAQAIGMEAIGEVGIVRIGITIITIRIIIPIMDGVA